MNKVHILPPEVISKIAAGEVIDRPASVIKELVENALDAKADVIEIHLQDAGKKLIQVRDNGQGIAQDDLETIFLRHATSKITNADDLFDIHSLGFRGEALYSVAAISDITLQSRTKEQDSGWEIHLRGGNKINLEPYNLAQNGTNIEIKELFFNTPARRKFLKSNTTEMNQILNILTPYTILNPSCRFRLTHQDRTLLNLSPTENQTARIAEILNLEQDHLITSSYQKPEENISIKLFLSDINVQRPRRDMQFLFINGRPVQSKSIFYHMNQIYRLILPPETFGFFAIFIELPANEIDVNIHPTKREVKVTNEQKLCSILRSVSEQALMQKSTLKKAYSPFTFNKGSSAHDVPRALTSSYKKDSSFETKNPNELFESTPSYSSEDYAYPRRPFGQTQEFFIPENNLIEQNQQSLQAKLEQARFIGNFINKYLLFESNSSLLLIDQHAAAERITYEQLIRHMDKGDLEVQNLLSPVLIKLSTQEFLLWEELKDDLNQLGFSSSQWDQETIAVHTQPQLLKDVERAVRQILSGERIQPADHASIARRACRSSIMAGDKLNHQQAEFQREQLLQCLDPFTCPHGRPIVIEMTEDFLNKQFLRT